MFHTPPKFIEFIQNTAKMSNQNACHAPWKGLAGMTSPEAGASGKAF